MKCTRCGRAGEQGFQFCENCGFAVGAVAATNVLPTSKSPMVNTKQWVLIGVGGFVALILIAGMVSRFVIPAKEPSATEAVKHSDGPTSSKVAWHNADRTVQFKSCLAPIEGKNLCFLQSFGKKAGIAYIENAKAIRYKSIRNS